MQALPQWGRRGALGDAAEADAEAADLALRAATADVELAAEELWLDLVALSATRDVLRANLDSFRSSAEVVRGRFEANLAGSSELFAIEEEAVRLEDELESTAAQYPVVWARMAALVGAEKAPAEGPRPGLESLGFASDGADAGDSPGAAALNAAAWRAALERGTWASLALTAREAGAAARIEVAEASNEPRFKLGVEYTFVGDDAPSANAGDDALAFSFGVSVPFWRDADAAEVERERALLRATRFERVAQRAADQARLEELLAAHDEHVRHLALLETRVIPLAQQTIAAEQRAYEAGSGSYLDLVRLQRRLYDDLLEAQLARIELERIALRLANLTRSAAPDVATSPAPDADVLETPTTHEVVSAPAQAAQPAPASQEDPR